MRRCRDCFREYLSISDVPNILMHISGYPREERGLYPLFIKFYYVYAIVKYVAMKYVLLKYI